MDMSCNHIGYRLSSKLWSHMAYTLDGNKVKTFVLLDKAGNLSIGLPLSPFFFNWPVQFFDPSLATVSGHCAIGVTRVEHQFDAVHL